MKKLKTALVLATLFISGFASAQAFDDGKNLLSLGFGFPASESVKETFSNYQGYENYNYKNYGTGVFHFEHGLSKYFGVGLDAQYSSAFVTYQTTNPALQTVTNSINNQVLGAYIRLNGHFPIGDHLDIFAGFGLGYQYTVNNGNQTGSLASSTTNFQQKEFDFKSQFTLGARYMIKDHFGLFAEVGWASTNVEMGITFGF